MMSIRAFASHGSPMTFDYTDPRKVEAPKERPWKIWKDNYFQRATFEGLNILPVDGLTACLGNFDLRMLAAGSVTPLPEGGHRISVDRVSMYLWDSFNFNGEDELGYWSCKHKKFHLNSFFLDDTYTQIFNSHFHAFRSRHSRGRDFMVLSEPKNIDVFEGFVYVTKP